MACWEVTLSKGQEWDWLGDPFWRVQTMVIVFILAFVGLLVRELRIANPVVNLRVLKERNLATSSVIIFSTFAVLYAATIALPSLLQTLFAYDAYHSGLVMAPAGFFAIATMLVVSRLLGRGFDARYFIAPGLVVVAAGSYWMALMNLQISPWQVVWPRVVMIVGLSLIFAPLNVAAYLYVPRHLRGAAVGLFALLRNEGGSVGTSLGQTLQERRDQFHLFRIDDLLTPLNHHVVSFLDRARAFFFHDTGDPGRARLMALQTLDSMRQDQASSLAYFNVFWVSAIMAVCRAPRAFPRALGGRKRAVMSAPNEMGQKDKILIKKLADCVRVTSASRTDCGRIETFALREDNHGRCAKPYCEARRTVRQQGQCRRKACCTRQHLPGLLRHYLGRMAGEVVAACREPSCRRRRPVLRGACSDHDAEYGFY